MHRRLVQVNHHFTYTTSTPHTHSDECSQQSEEATKDGTTDSNQVPTNTIRRSSTERLGLPTTWTATLALLGVVRWQRRSDKRSWQTSDSRRAGALWSTNLARIRMGDLESCSPGCPERFAVTQATSRSYGRAKLRTLVLEQHQHGPPDFGSNSQR